MIRIVLIFAFCASVFMNVMFAAHAMAQDLPPIPFLSLPTGDGFDDLQKTGDVKVEAVIAPDIFYLADGRSVALTGVYFPDAFGADMAPGRFYQAALAVMKDMFEGQMVALYRTKNKNLGRFNRMRHALAHIERQSDNAWAQGTLLQLGLALVHTTERNTEMARKMYALEQRARIEKSGLWEDPQTGIVIRSPDNAGAHLNSFQIVEGTIQSTALKNNRVFLNFGADWRTDFTISIAPEHKRTFSKQKINPMDWQNKTVRVRGWLREYNGPFIDITHPEAVQVIGE